MLRLGIMLAPLLTRRRAALWCLGRACKIAHAIQNTIAHAIAACHDLSYAAQDTSVRWAHKLIKHKLIKHVATMGERVLLNPKP